MMVRQLRRDEAVGDAEEAEAAVEVGVVLPISAALYFGVLGCEITISR